MTNYDAEPNPNQFLDEAEYNRTRGLYQKAVLKPGLFTRFNGDDFWGTNTYEGSIPGHDDPTVPDDKLMGVRREIGFTIGPVKTKLIFSLYSSAIAMQRRAHERGEAYEGIRESIEKYGLTFGSIIVGDMDEASDEGRLTMCIDLQEQPAILYSTYDTIPGKTPETAKALEKFAGFLGLDPRFASGERAFEDKTGAFTDEDLIAFNQGLERLVALDTNEVAL